MEYKRVAKDPSFAPRAILETSQAMRQSAEQQKADMRQFIADQRQQDQQRIEDTKFVGQNLKAAAQFSESALALTKMLVKQGYESRKINEYVDGVTGANENQAETSIIAQGDADNKATGNKVSKANEEGNSVTAYQETEKNRVGRGVANERMLLQDSKGYLLSRVPAILNDPTVMLDIGYGPVSIIDLKADPNNAALVTKYALRMAIRERGLQYTTKRNFKDILGGTIEQIRTNTPAQLASKAISDMQTEDKQKLANNATAWGFSMRGGSEADMQKAYNNVRQNSQALNTGMGRGTANQFMVQSMVSSLKDPDDIRRFSTVKMDNGATLGGTFPLYFEDAIKKAEAGVLADNKLKAEEQSEAGLAELEQMRAQGKSIEEIEERRDQLATQIGALNGSVGQAFNGRTDTLVLGKLKEEKFDDFQANILGGKTYSKAELINSGLDSSQISRLESMQKDTATVDLVKETTDADDKLLKQATLAAGGIKLDRYTESIIERGWVDADVLTRSLQTFKEERQEHLRAYAATIRDKPIEEQRTLMRAEAQRWSDEQLNAETGAFKALGILKKAGNESKALGKEMQDIVRTQLRQFANPNAPVTIEGTRAVPVDLSSRYQPGGVVPDNLAGVYAKKGKLTSNVRFFTFDETQEYLKEYKETGQVPADAITAGESLGVSGLDFLNQQANAYRLEPAKAIKAAKTVRPSPFGAIKPGPDLTSPQRRQIYPEVASALVGKGFTQNASVALARAFSEIDLNNWDETIEAMQKDPVMAKALKDATKTPKQIIRLYNNYVRRQ